MFKFRCSDFFFSCDFNPGLSLGVYREGHPTPWSQSSLLRLDKKVTGHSKNTYLQHCIWHLISISILSRSVPIFHVSLSIIYLLSIIYRYTRFYTHSFFSIFAKDFPFSSFLQYFKYLEGLIGSVG